ncbi:hypothetical protein NC658_32970 [Streptomyces griseoincarnatus]|uniref:PH domain-containing protein n=1 Tax=Streptomyces griseoincarnatus TaxID=29305 RepID=A0ABT0W3W4_STRGI|nr:MULTISPECIES: hypothetical protein [Streptomyces]MBJ6613785.1 hypothetical protein [Streptomyces sp. I3(2020)]MBJ6628863.1 hypothetical protein [Streptomyces sp. I4(2020)]MCM2518001.1 hypothetical protein [Streptomyces griseoincarnatus]
MDAEREALDRTGAHGGAVEFWNDWRHSGGSVAVAVLAGALGTVVMLAAVRTADAVEDWVGLFVVGTLLILAGAMLTVGVTLLLVLGWDADRVLVRCTYEGLVVGDDTHPWNTVRTVALGYKVVEAGPESSTERRPPSHGYHLVIGTDSGAVQVMSRVWRSRGEELAAVVRRHAPGARVEWRNRSAFRSRQPPRPAPPSRGRVRMEAVALVAGSFLFGGALCGALLHWAPTVITFG